MYCIILLSSITFAALAQHWRVREGNVSALIFVHTIIIINFFTRVANNLYRENNADREEIFRLGTAVLYEDRKQNHGNNNVYRDRKY